MNTLCKAATPTLVGLAIGLACTTPVVAQTVVNPVVIQSSARVGQLAIDTTPYEPIVVQSAQSAGGVFNSAMIFLADQLDRNVDPSLRTRPTVVTAMANLADLGETSNLGRLMAEHLLHELQVRSWSVADIRFTRSLIINDGGEFSLSRDIKQLRESLPVSNVLVGTYTSTHDGVLVSVRVMDSASGNILSTAQTRLPRSRFVSGLLDKPVAPPQVKLTAACSAGAPCTQPR